MSPLVKSRTPAATGGVKKVSGNPAEKNPEGKTPQDEASELALLGSIYVSNGKLFDDPKFHVSEDHFYIPAHREIFGVFRGLHTAKKPLDDTLIISMLKDSERLEAIGGVPFLNKLFDVVPTSANWSHYAPILERKWLGRSRLAMAARMRKSVYDGESLDDSELVALLEADLSTARGLVDGKASARADLFTDLAPYLDGDVIPEMPTVAGVLGEKGLFYAGRLNEIHGEPAIGKTNIMLAASIAVLQDGGSVLYIDPEDTPAGIVGRLRSLGAQQQDVAERFYYLHNPTPDVITSAHAWARVNKPTLVIADGLAELLASEGLIEDSAGDILTFFRSRLRPFAESGSAVVIADHVTKGTENRGRWARGSGAKLGRYDGVAYEIELGESYSRDKAGFIRFKVSKDRNSGVGPQGKVIIELHFTPDEDGKTRLTFKPPTETGPFRPTAIMAKIEQHLRIVGEANKTGLRSLGGKSQYVDQAIAIMLAEGSVLTRQTGQQIFYRICENEA